MRLAPHVPPALRSLLPPLCLAGLLGCGGGSGVPLAEAGEGPDTSGLPSPSTPAQSATPAVTAAAALEVERLDADAECDALVPGTIPAPVTIRLSPPAGGTCVAGPADGSGAVALGTRDAAGSTTWHAVTAGGQPAGTFAAEALVATPDGWQGLAVAGDAVEHLAVAPDGRIRRATPVSPDPAVRTGFRWSLARDPAGGSLVLFRSVTVAGNHWNALDASRFDASGAPRWPGAVEVSLDPDASEPFFMAAGLSTTGASLLLFQDSAYLRARWVEPSGQAREPADAAPEPFADVVGEGLAHELELAPLLDGSLAIRSDGAWRRRWAPLADRSEPLPGWLSERADWSFRFTRGNAGYAALEPAGRSAPDCTQRIELVAPSGRLCGRVTLREEGASCTTGALDQGWDGTVVQQSAADACTFRWWPRLLAGG